MNGYRFAQLFFGGLLVLAGLGLFLMVVDLFV